jgi:PAS domain S-box-containing protein
LVFACVGSAVLAAALLIAYNYHRERDDALEDSRAKAQAVVNSVDREMENIQWALYALGTSPYIEAGDTAGFQAQATRALKDLKAFNIVLTDASGQQVMNTAARPGEPLPNDGQPPSIRALFTSGKPVISDLFAGKVIGKQIFSVAVPIVKDGKVIYSLGAGVSPEVVDGVLKQQALPAHWIAVVVDRTGTIVARSHQLDLYTGQKASPPLLHELGERSEGSFQGTTLEGVDVFTSYSRSKNTGWAVALGIPKSGITQDLWLAVGVAVLVVALLLLAGLATAWHIGSRISRSILELARTAFALGQGRTIPVPPLYFREADVLGETLVTASDLLQEASAAVDRRDAQLASILDTANDAIISVDDDQRVILYNRAAAAMFGWPKEEAIGRPLSQFIPPRLRKAHDRYIRQFGLGGAARRRMGQQSKVIGVNSAGEEFSVEASISKVNEGGATLYTAVLRDIAGRGDSAFAAKAATPEEPGAMLS